MSMGNVSLLNFREGFFMCTHENSLFCVGSERTHRVITKPTGKYLISLWVKTHREIIIAHREIRNFPVG
jgi:hypothetical protein